MDRGGIRSSNKSSKAPLIGKSTEPHRRRSPLQLYGDPRPRAQPVTKHLSFSSDRPHSSSCPSSQQSRRHAARRQWGAATVIPGAANATHCASPFDVKRTGAELCWYAGYCDSLALVVYMGSRDLLPTIILAAPGPTQHDALSHAGYGVAVLETCSSNDKMRSKVGAMIFGVVLRLLLIPDLRR